MEKKLEKNILRFYHIIEGKAIDGKNEKMSGDCSGLRGNCSSLIGVCSGLRGVLDKCKITNEERQKGVDINELIK